MSFERFGKQPDSPLGNTDKIFLAQNKDREINLKASSGGVIKAVLTHLFSTGEINAVISIKHKAGLDYSPELIGNINEINELPDSIYHNINYSNAFQLLREISGNIAIVAIPCQFDGLFKFIEQCEPHLKNKIKLTIGLMCGWTYSHHSLRAICEYKGIDFEQIDDVSYRGNGPVGKLIIRTKDGSVTKVNRRIDLHYAAAFDRSFNIPRCHYCINHGNFLADLVVGDAWLPCTVKTKTGISLVISRTTKSTEYLMQLETQEILTLIESSEDDVIESQTPRVVFGNYSYPFAELTRNSGRFAPQFSGPNGEATTPVSNKILEKFGQRIEIKRKMQKSGKYNKLLIYKYTHEFRPFLYRYIRWFFVRILKIKSITGSRKEISSEKVGKFL
ncbi:MAG: Coenzyme F420 hydrogenase/dehydrogenase, beta subunit C-terminal domain [Victivallaceae bacterium]|nr:Coenzyme F420 hydrogenase/dehydrogenase, beta subunit C-terminal domain [Victivallaceae bacterium]